MPDLPAFEVSYDYLCPFAHVAHEHVVAALRAGAPLEVTFTPWALRQVHKAEDAPDVWEDPEKRDELLALAASLVVRDTMPERFLDVHLALFRARHERGIRLSTREEVLGVLAETGVDLGALGDALDTGQPLKELGANWRRLSEDYGAFGVPTFVANGEAVFVRLMRRPDSDADAVATVTDLVSRLVGETNVNEFKRTKIPR